MTARSHTRKARKARYRSRRLTFARDRREARRRQQGKRRR